jgi:hypothetical protein
MTVLTDAMNTIQGNFAVFTYKMPDWVGADGLTHHFQPKNPPTWYDSLTVVPPSGPIIG